MFRTMLKTGGANQDHVADKKTNLLMKAPFKGNRASSSLPKNPLVHLYLIQQEEPTEPRVFWGISGTQHGPF